MMTESDVGSCNRAGPCVPASTAGGGRGTGTSERPVLVSRFKRFKSARSSAAVWHRRSRSFSKALLMMCSNFGRALWIQTHGRGRSFVEDPVKDEGGSRSDEGRMACGHLIKHHAEAEQVGAGVEFFAPRLLRRHVRHRAHRHARTG